MIPAAADVLHGEVLMVVRDQPQGCSLDSTHFHGPKVVSSEVITDWKLTLIIGAYLPPYTLEHLPDLEEALTRFWYQDTIFMEDLNAKIGQAQNLRSQQVADLLM